MAGGDTTFNWSSATATVNVGEAITVTSTVASISGLSYTVADPSIATASTLNYTSWTITGVSAGTTTVTVNGASSGSTVLTVTVNQADDDEFLNKRGLTHFWDNAKTAILDMTYPVGSIFMSTTLSTTSAVASALGGTWTAWGAGRVPVGVDSGDTDFDTVEETGGSKDLQQHSHNTINWATGYTTGSQSGYFNVLCGASSSNTKKAVADAGTGNAV